MSPNSIRCGRCARSGPLLALLVLCAPAATRAGEDLTPNHRLTFADDGRLIGSTPDRLKSGETVEFRVVTGAGTRLASIEDAVRRLVKLASPPRAPAPSMPDPAPALIPLDPSARAALRAAACDRLNTLTEAVWLPESQKTSLVVQFANTCAGVKRDESTRHLPALETLVGRTIDEAPAEGAGYRLEYRCLDADGAPGALKPKAEVLKGGVTLSAQVTIEPGCAAIAFDLRRQRPWSAAIDRWALEVADRLATPQDRGAAAAVLEAARTAQAFVQASRAALACVQPPGPAACGMTQQHVGQSRSAFRQADADLTAALAGLSTQAALWMWTASGKPAVDPGDVAARRAAVARRKAELMKAEAHVRTLETIVAGPGAQIELEAGFGGAVESLGEMRARRDTAQARLKAAEKALQAAIADRQSDALLYRGRLIVSTDTRPARMRHHDARRGHALIDAEPVHEIDARDRLVVQIANAPPGEQLRVTVAAVDLANDSALNTDALARGWATAVAPVASTAVPALTAAEQTFPDAPTPAAMRAWAKDADALAKRAEAAAALAGAAARFAASAPDDTPTYTSRPVHFDRGPAPAQVTYTLTREGAGESDPPLAKSGYRLNERYRMRFKAGVAYSVRHKADYVIPEVPDGADPASVEAHDTGDVRGLDGTVGLLIYSDWHGRDIRAETWNLWPVGYAGLSVTGPLSDLYLGGGFEPVSGLTLIAGWNHGTTEVLASDDSGRPFTRADWGGGLFTSVLFDPLLFARVFGLDLEL